ncbi:hypothetical protein QJ48_00085 [Paenibacillus sp. A3]|nr:hypothetical protein QJ48_00085 [Paenibacillus sp. A3]
MFVLAAVCGLKIVSINTLMEKLLKISKNLNRSVRYTMKSVIWNEFAEKSKIPRIMVTERKAG